MKTKLFIDGEHGTTGLQIRTRLAHRDDLDILSLPETDRRNDELRQQKLQEADIAILCLPDDAARQAVSMIDSSTRIIDTSTAHRSHPDWVYGFAEFKPGQAARIKTAHRVSNPGCYSTGAIALIRPLIDAGILAKDAMLTINAISGYTGGGKQLIRQMEQAQSDDAITAEHFTYALGLQHKHLPEIKNHCELVHAPLFTPSVGRFAQGMLVNLPLFRDQLEDQATRNSLFDIYTSHYQAGPLVKVVDPAISTNMPRLETDTIAGEDHLEIHLFGNDEGPHFNLVARLDNLGKGASGAAVQNLNLMLEG